MNVETTGSPVESYQIKTVFPNTAPAFVVGYGEVMLKYELPMGTHFPVIAWALCDIVYTDEHVAELSDDEFQADKYTTEVLPLILHPWCDDRLSFVFELPDYEWYELSSVE